MDIAGTKNGDRDNMDRVDMDWAKAWTLDRVSIEAWTGYEHRPRKGA